MFEYLFLDNDEKSNIINYDYNYYNIINIVNKYQRTLDINSLFNKNDNKYEKILNINFNDPISGIYFIIQSSNIKTQYKLYNNYSGVNNNSIANIDNNYYNININNTIPILNNIFININNIPFKHNIDSLYYNHISQYNTHTSINNSIYYIPFSLFSETSQPSGHINLNSDINIEIKIRL